MALNCTRLLCQKNMGLYYFRGLHKLSSSGLSLNTAKTVTTQACESFDAKNKRLKRPLSPHLTIYKPQLTTMLSITHRGTGMALAFYAMGAAFTELCLPGGMNCLIESIHALALPMPVLFLGKLSIAWPAMYHYFNGIRHLSWDLGMFLSIKHVYSTGWTVVGISTIAAIILSAIF